MTSTSKHSTAYLAGQHDGRDWDVPHGTGELHEALRDLATSREGFDDATINAIGFAEFGRLCGLTERQIGARGSAWTRACRVYDRACRLAILSR